MRTMRYNSAGSTVALTNETGALVESDAYDAWGKQRNATTGADDTTCAIPQTDFSNRGFTGHEQLGDGLCLINMNARIYDPVIGRFLSPDDVIPDLYNGQSYNRYTYVENNPLSYTDPTGHAPIGSFQLNRRDEDTDCQRQGQTALCLHVLAHRCEASKIKPERLQ